MGANQLTLLPSLLVCGLMLWRSRPPLLALVLSFQLAFSAQALPQFSMIVDTRLFSPPSGEWTGWEISGVLTFTPYDCWRRFACAAPCGDRQPHARGFGTSYADGPRVSRGEADWAGCFTATTGSVVRVWARPRLPVPTSTSLTDRVGKGGQALLVSAMAPTLRSLHSGQR